MGRIGLAGRRGRKRKQLLDGIKEKRMLRDIESGKH
jgi:hypothetical protein